MLRTAVYSTVYPGCEPYLRAWFASLQGQDDTRFDLWVGADSLTRESVEEAVGGPIGAAFVTATQPESPAALRRRCLHELCRRYDLVVLLDCDDEANPARVSAAKGCSAAWSLSACALELVDARGRPTGRLMTVGQPVDWSRLLPSRNVIGMSNSAYEASLLRELLVFPDDCELVDWFMATRAWLLGASIRWEPRPLVRYRQHGANTAAVVPPFGLDDIRRATELVHRHHRRIRSQVPIPGTPDQHRLLAATAARVERFRLAIQYASVLSQYTDAFNRLGGELAWWQMVACDGLEELWSA